MKILLISSLYPSSPGGHPLERTLALHHLAKHWGRSNEVMVLRPRFFYLGEMFGKNKKYGLNEFKRNEFTMNGVKVVVFPILKIPKVAYLYFFLMRFLKSHAFKPDVVVAHYEKCLSIGATVSRLLKVPLIAGIHAAPDVSEPEPARFADRCGDVLKQASRIACRSPLIFRKMSQWFPHYKEKCFVAASGIETSHIVDNDFARSKLDAWKKEGKPLQFVSVCSLIPRKNVAVILNALKEFGDSIEWSYSIIGDGPERGDLQLLAERLGLAHRVRFLGRMPHGEAIGKIKEAHVFVLVSTMETFGMVYLEAMASGTLTVGLKGDGLDGLLLHMENGLLADSPQPEDLLKVLDLAALQLERNRLAQLLDNALDTVSGLTDEEVARRYLEQIRDVVNG